MSTEWGKINSSNEIYKNDTLEVVECITGNIYFFLDFKEDVKRNQPASTNKFWINPETWEQLKTLVEMRFKEK